MLGWHAVEKGSFMSFILDATKASVNESLLENGEMSDPVKGSAASGSDIEGI